jgi:hypothetical protein
MPSRVTIAESVLADHDRCAVIEPGSTVDGSNPMALGFTRPLSRRERPYRRLPLRDLLMRGVFAKTVHSIRRDLARPVQGIVIFEACMPTQGPARRGETTNRPAARPHRCIFHPARCDPSRPQGPAIWPLFEAFREGRRDSLKTAERNRSNGAVQSSSLGTTEAELWTSQDAEKFVAEIDFERCFETRRLNGQVSDLFTYLPDGEHGRGKIRRRHIEN